MSNNSSANTGERGLDLLTTLPLHWALKTVSLFATLYCVRRADPELWGISLQHEVFQSIVIFITREPVRNTVLRLRIRTNTEARRVQNLGNLLGLCIFMSSYLSQFYALPYFSSQCSPYLSKFFFAAASFEALAEPRALLLFSQFSTASKISLECIASLLRSVLCAGLLSFNFGESAYGLSQLAYGICMFVGYETIHVKRLKRDKGKTKPNEKSHSILNLPKGIGPTVLHMGAECFLRMALNEGEKLTLMAVASHSSLALYHAVSHLVSIVCRIVLSPLEDLCFGVWSKLLHNGLRKDRSKAHKLLHQLLRLVVSLGWLIAGIGIPHASAIVSIFLGSNWITHAECTPLFQIYCSYVIILAVNGLMEAFFRSAAPNAWLRRGQLALLIINGIYFTSSILLTKRIGVFGVVISNIFSMVLRIIFCGLFVWYTQPEFPVASFCTIFFPLPLVSTLLLSYGASVLLCDVQNNFMLSICFAGVRLIFSLCVFYILERRSILDVRKILISIE